MWGVKQILLIMAVVIGQSVLAADEVVIKDPIVEKAIRHRLKKPEGELTKADLAKVTRLSLFRTKITDAGLKDVAKLQELTGLYLGGTQITDAGVAELKKALPKCNIWHNSQKAIVEKAIRDRLKKPEGELTKADLAKITRLSLSFTKITDAGLKEVAKLQKLTYLFLTGTQITKVGVAELKKALPRCRISHTAKK